MAKKRIMLRETAKESLSKFRDVFFSNKKKPLREHARGEGELICKYILIYAKYGTKRFKMAHLGLTFSQIEAKHFEEAF